MKTTVHKKRRISEKSLKNLVPIKKGQVLNPNGRPKDISITSLLRKELRRLDPESKKTYKQLFVEALVKHAIKGQPQIMNYILDRHDGKVVEEYRHEINNKLSIELIRQIREDAGLKVPKEWSDK